MIPQRTPVIAEVGVNHNGDLQLAKELLEAATDAGDDEVKLQTFQANHCATVTFRKVVTPWRPFRQPVSTVAFVAYRDHQAAD